MQDLEYQIKKDCSQKSFLITIISVFGLLILILIIFGPGIISGLKKNVISSEGIIAGSIVWGLIIISILVILYVRFKRWEYPFRTRWNRNGIIIGYPGGKIKELYWEDVQEIKLEGENWLKMLVPLYYVGRFSWNSTLWLLYAGVTKPIWRINFAFFHFRLKNNKIISVPIRKENLNKAVDILKSIKLENTKVKSFSETKSKRWLIALLISIPFSLAVSTESMSQFLLMEIQ